MRVGKRNVQKFKYHMNEDLHQVEVEKDLGVNIDQELNFSEHFAEKN